MNLEQSAIVLRPRSLGEILDLACLWSGSHALSASVRLSAIVLLPSYALLLFAHYGLELSWLWVWLFAVLVVTAGQGMFTVSVGRRMFLPELSTRETWRIFRQRLGAYVGTLVLSRIQMVFGALLIVPLPWIWIRLLFVHEACLLEMASASEAVRRSSRFTNGRGGPLFALLLALWAAHLAGVLLGELLGQFVVDKVLQLGQPFGSLWSDGGSPYALAGLLLSVPFTTTARFIAYIDGRTRRDGWDIQVRFLAIAARAASGRSA